MKVIDVYKQYLSGECVYNEVERKGVVVTLTATSDSGNIMYEVGISFFPHRDEEDFGISYDAYASKEIYNDIVNILDLSCDYAESNVKSITSMEFHDKLSDIVHKYNPELVDRLNQVQVLDRKATPLLEDNKDNN